MPDDIEDVAISSEMIRLGQLLKFVGIAESGAHAGAFIASGDVRVNGQLEMRRGRQLLRGDIVEIATPAGAARLRVS